MRNAEKPQKILGAAGLVGLSVLLSAAAGARCQTADKIYKIECEQDCYCVRRNDVGDEIERHTIEECVEMGVDNAMTVPTIDKLIECCQDDIITYK